LTVTIKRNGGKRSFFLSLFHTALATNPKTKHGFKAEAFIQLISLLVTRM